MRVCDKCRKPIERGNPLEIHKQEFEVCDECAAKILQWLKEPIKKQGVLGSLLGVNK